jgi:hypothetical protein
MKQAIQWARGYKVDIILMSWTISSYEPHSKEIKALQTQVTEAGKEDILMFASASDQGEINDEVLFPGNSEGDHCVRIGAASDEGTRLAWVNRKWCEFLVPGKEIIFRDYETGSYFTETGSSLANACAAGLAGALLYCERLLRIRGVETGRDLHNSRQLKQMLRGLSREGHPFIDAEKLLKDLTLYLKERPKQHNMSLQIDQDNWTLEKEALAKVLNNAWVVGGARGK